MENLVANMVVRVLSLNGYEAYLVGGCVRDKIMGHKPKDYDVTTNATPAQVMELFSETIPVGASFGVVRVRIDGVEIEVATYRADGDYSDGRRPDTVEFSKTVNEDVVRRDFTLNGLLQDSKGDVIDLVGGLQDIHNKYISAIGDPIKRFEEDSLRMLRAIRFAARFDFKIEFNTLAALISKASTIKRVSQERITNELLQMLSGPRPSIAIKLLEETTLLAEIFPKYHSMDIVLNKFRGTRTKNPMVALVLFLSELSEKEFVNVLNQLKLSNEQKQVATLAYSYKHKMREFITADLATLKRFKRLVGAKEAMTVFIIESSYGVDQFPQAGEIIFRLDNCETSYKPLITGNDLIAAGYKPGPLFSTVLNVVETAQLNEDITTQEQALSLAKMAMSMGSENVEVFVMSRPGGRVD